MDPHRSNPRRWNPWPVSIMAFFAVAIAGCIAFVVFCCMHGTELVAADYYEQEVRYQSEMERVQRAVALGPEAVIRYDSAGDQVRIVLPTAHLSGKLTGRIDFYRPSSASMDRQIALKPDSEGKQTVSTAELPPGPWRIKFTWEAGGESYQLNQTLVVTRVGIP